MSASRIGCIPDADEYLLILNLKFFNFSEGKEK
jgi:hypothetical protein